MEQKVFEILLNDLYDKYNPSNKKEIDNIIKKYVGQELDAIYYFLIKYNYPKHPNYDPKLNDINNVKELIVNYISGSRSILEKKPNISFEDQIKKNIVKEAENKIQTQTEQFAEEINVKFSSIKSEIEKIKNDLNKKSQDLSIEIKLNILYDQSELNIPKEIETFGIGTRFLTKDTTERLIALEIKDIFFDFVSNPDCIIKEITIDKI
jgi:hypothetical protein